MNRDIEDFVDHCDTCERRRPSGCDASGSYETPISPGPWHTVAVDLVAMPVGSNEPYFQFSDVFFLMIISNFVFMISGCDTSR